MNPKEKIQSPPKWANKFLEWYCRADLLEEIQGDAYELYHRKVKKNKTIADIYFTWNVIRFFRWKNIKSSKKRNNNNPSSAMIKNIFKVSLRNFVRQPGQFMTHLLGLSAGMVCAIFILLWVTHEFSFDRFHHDNENIFKVLTHAESDGRIQTYGIASCSMDISSVPEIQTLTGVAKGDRWPFELCFRPDGKQNECSYLKGVYSTENLFSTFNFPILHGDQNPIRGATNIAISEKMATLLFNKENPVGKTIKIDDQYQVTIVSVFKNVPVNSSIQFDFVMPYAVLQKLWGVNDEGFKQNFFEMYVKTNTRVVPSQLNEKLNNSSVLPEALKKQGIRYEACPFNDWHLSKFEGGKNIGGRIEYVRLFIIIGILVVIMAVINFINLSTARATLRSKEIGVRKVTGATKAQVFAQFMGESFLIVSVTFIISIGSVYLLLPYFNRLLGETISIELTNPNLLISFAIFLVAISFLAGIYPALVMSSFQPVRALKGQLTMTAKSGSSYLRKSLLAIQLSASIGIIIFTGVLYRQLKFMGEKDLGFDHHSMIHIEPTYKLLQKFEPFKNELLKNPAIINAAASSHNPINTGGGNTEVSWPGKAANSRIMFKTFACSYDFPGMMGLKILDGRDFRVQSEDSVRTEALVTQDAVKIMNLADPVGQEIKIGDATCVIIGVVNDFHTQSLHEAKLPVILFRTPYIRTSGIYVRYEPGKTREAMVALNEVYSKFEPNFTMRYDFQDENYNQLYKTEQVASRLIIVFTIVAIVIAIVGIAGLATFNTLRRTKEISIRRIFGASIAQSIVLLSTEFLWILCTASALACVVSWHFADNWLQGFAYRASMPWWIFITTVIGTGLLVLLLILWQGLKAVVANPASTLRSE